jgi:hypothetical protein
MCLRRQLCHLLLQPLPLLGLGLPFFWDLDKLRRRRRLGDELHQVILQEAQYVSTTTPT